MPQTLIRTPGAELIIDNAGDGEPALIFLHYWGGSARTWTPVIARLPVSVRTVAVNQRGWGGSRVTDERYGLDALADDVEAIAEALALRRYILVGHSMGGKVAQLVAGRRPTHLSGLVLVAPAPPLAMPVPAEIRAGILASYQSRAGVLDALAVLGGAALPEPIREQLIADTLRGDPEAKRSWAETGMIADLGAAAEGLSIPVEIIVGADDQVEQPSMLRPLFAGVLPGASFTIVPDAGHLLPLAAPDAVAEACMRVLVRSDDPILGLGVAGPPIHR